ncbi:hypothetical protein HK104_009263 [Borealophlyctis nickersoniae]|nr:hypothetical protein HK104_009263 [Borealophlyctis nickersoniae]
MMQSGQEVTGTVAMGGMTDYKVFIDDPDNGKYIVISLNPGTPADAQLTVDLISYHPQIRLTTPQHVLPSTDPRRVSGYYVFHIVYPTTSSVASPATFRFRVYTTPPARQPSGTGSPYDPSGGSSNVFGSLDLTTFVTVFVCSMLLSVIMTYLFRRTRERLMLLRMVREGEVMLVPVEPPPLFRVMVGDMSSASGGAREGGRVVPPPKVAGCGDEMELGPMGGGGMTGHKILRTVEVSEETTGTSGTRHRSPRQKSYPLSVEMLPAFPSPAGPTTPMVPLVAVSYLLLMPGWETHLQNGVLPPVQVATALGRDSARGAGSGHGTEGGRDVDMAAGGNDWGWWTAWKRKMHQRTTRTTPTTPLPPELLRQVVLVTDQRTVLTLRHSSKLCKLLADEVILSYMAPRHIKIILCA